MRFTTKQMLAGVAVIAMILASLVRGYKLLGSNGLWIFAAFTAAATVLVVLLVFGWRAASWPERVIHICLVCMTLIPILIPKLVLTDYDHMRFIAKKEHSAMELNRLLAIDSRFANIRVRFEAPKNHKGQWLMVSGSVETETEFDRLQELVNGADDWHVEWDVRLQR